MRFGAICSILDHISFQNHANSLQRKIGQLSQLRLLCLKGNEMSFTQFIEEIKQKGNCRVYRVNPDFSKKRLFDGVFDKSLFNRAKRYANATGVNIEINAYGHSEVVTPDIENSRMHEGSPPISDCQDC